MPQNKGAIPWNKGKTGHLSSSSILKMRLAKLGKKYTEEHRANQSKSMRGIKKGPFTEEHRAKLALAKLGKPGPWAGKKRPNMTGENSPSWIADRSKLAKRQERNDSAYKEWRKSVRDRDGWKCTMSNGDCLGKVVAHHILPWARFPELRYEINNGITLCRFHHPRRREDEMKLSPYFQQLVMSNSN